jgi:hypothetical protein
LLPVAVRDLELLQNSSPDSREHPVTGGRGPPRAGPPSGSPRFPNPSVFLAAAASDARASASIVPQPSTRHSASARLRRLSPDSPCPAAPVCFDPFVNRGWLLAASIPFASRARRGDC